MDKEISDSQELLSLFDNRLDIFPENHFGSCFCTKDNFDVDLFE